MRDVGPASGVVHGVGHVPHEHDVAAVPGELPQAERPAEDAHVRVHAEEHDVRDAPRLEEVPDLHPRIADRVVGGDLERVELREPGRPRVAAQSCQPPMPGLVLHRIVVLAPVRLVDRILHALLGGNPPAPRADVRGQVRRGRGRPGPLAGGMPLVGRHAPARCVDHEHAPAPGGPQDLVHARRHLLHASHRAQAVVRVPHVADDDGRRPRVPGFRRIPRHPDAVLLDAPAHVDDERRVSRPRGLRSRCQGRCGHGRDHEPQGGGRGPHHAAPGDTPAGNLARFGDCHLFSPRSRPRQAVASRAWPSAVSASSASYSSVGMKSMSP